MKEAKKESLPVVLVVDDDESVRAALTNLFRSMHFDVLVFGSAPELMASKLPDAASCLVLDIRLPGVNGLEFQGELAKAGIHLPIVFMTGHGDIPMSVKAMKAGAIDFLTKPFRDQDMQDAVTRALQHDRVRCDGEETKAKLRRLFESLTPREREVMTLVTKGLMNKQIAHEMQISEIMVKLHRGRMMRKMQAGSLAELVRKFDMLKPDLKLYQ